MNIIPGQGYGGAMTYKSGVLWVGLFNELYKSTDDGASFQKTSYVHTGDIISEISFFDDKTGVIASAGAALQMTTDGGLTWRTIKSRPGMLCISAKFLRSKDEIVAGYIRRNPLATVADNSFVSVTMDGGLSWDDHFQFPDGTLGQLQTSFDGKIYAIELYRPQGGELWSSSDFGASWSVANGLIDSDCYSFCLDNCDPGVIYVINEQLYLNRDPSQRRTGLYFSNDNGNSWQRRRIIDTGYYSTGALICSDRQVLYTQTLSSNILARNDGIIRTTDGGQSWKSIGGPIGTSDSRLIAYKDNNTLFAAADDGSIWKTTTSGGDPLPGSGGSSNVLLSKNSLFGSDTILPCDTNLRTQGVGVLIGGCNPPVVASQSISGADAAEYSIITPIGSTPLSGDSIVFSFHPSSPGQKSATYTFTLTDGRVFSIQLLGTGTAPTPLTLSTITSFQVDTIGDSAHVPITVNGLKKPTTIEMRISYDPANLVYVGTTSLAGTLLDIPGTTVIGSSQIRIPASDVSLTGPSAIAHFLCYADTISIPKVTIDMLTVPDVTVSCAYTINTRTITDIIIPAGCGVPTISYFLRHKTLPFFSIAPNPSSGLLTISSTVANSNLEVELYTPMGIRQSNISLSKIDAKHFELHGAEIPAGTYFLKITSPSGTSIHTVIFSK